MNELVTNQVNLGSFTPIEIVLGIDEEGKTTARKLYEFLELADSQFARWARKNIETNRFFEGNKDWWGFDIMSNGNPTKDYKITIEFAKHLSMSSQNHKGKIARDYFIKVEDKLRQIAQQKFENEVSREVGKIIRRELTDVLKESGLNDKMHGHGYSTFTDLIYKLVLGMSAKKYREATGLPAGANVREHINQYQLHEIARLEKAAQSMIDIGMNYEEIKRILSEKFLKQLTVN
jgi:phage anti-repressor protein